MRIVMWISAILHWLVIAPGLRERPDEFPMGLFLARLPILSPLLWWALFNPAYSCTVSTGAIVIAVAAIGGGAAIDIVIIRFQTDVQALSARRK